MYLIFMKILICTESFVLNFLLNSSHSSRKFIFFYLNLKSRAHGFRKPSLFRNRGAKANCEWGREKSIGGRSRKNEKRKKRKEEKGRTGKLDKKHSSMNYKCEVLETVLAILIYLAKENEAHAWKSKLKTIQL